MRFSLPVSPLLAALLSAVLAACASAPEAPAKNVPQSGALKVHPGLLGQPVPPELQPPQETPANGTKPAEPGKLKLDDAGLRTQRSVYFDLDSAELRAEFTAMLQAHARYLAQRPNSRVRLEGNADERGSADHNKKLGLKRAEAVKASLLGHGLDDKQVRIVSLGEAKPKLKGHDEESWAENRRTDIVYEKEE